VWLGPEKYISAWSIASFILWPCLLTIHVVNDKLFVSGRTAGFIIAVVKRSECRNELDDEIMKSCLRDSTSHTIQILRTYWQRNRVRRIVVLLSFRIKPQDLKVCTVCISTFVAL
jgi:hypothetical protein